MASDRSSRTISLGELHWSSGNNSMATTIALFREFSKAFQILPKQKHHDFKLKLEPQRISNLQEKKYIILT
jgi:hypothetical protein